MYRSELNKLLEQEMTRKQFLAFSVFAVASVFGLVGLLKLLTSHAATPTAAFEPEDGSLGGVNKVADGSASGGSAVKFAAGTNTFVAFASGTVKPLSFADEAAGLGTRNVGPRITNLTPYNGDYTLTPGAKVSGLEIFGRLVGRGDATTEVSDCIIHGSATPASADSSTALGTSYDFGGVTIQWCSVLVASNMGFTDVIRGGNYTLKYSELAGGVDGIGASIVGDATVECCRIWDGYYFSWWNASTNSVRTATFTDADGVVHPTPFPAQSSGDTHSDGVQIQSYDGWVIRGCYIGGNRAVTPRTHLDPTIAADCTLMKQMDSGREYVNSCILISSRDTSGTHNVGALIENNWFEGSGARVNVAYKAYDDMSGVTVRNNRFIRGNYGYYIYKQIGNASVFSNNVFDDTGAAVPVNTYP